MPSENIETQRSIPLALQKIIFTTTKLFYKKKISRAYSLLSFNIYYSFLIALIFYICQVINMSHSDLNDPNVLIPLWPLFSVQCGSFEA
jgi:hypothetical protein